MNEVIKKFAQEAGAHTAIMSAHAKFYDSIASASADTRSANEMFIEKFAELLLKEFAYDCMDATAAPEHIKFVAKKWGVEL